MALIDVIGLGSGRRAVIFDIGSVYSKIGIAGEFSPRHIIRSEVTTCVDNVLKTITFLEVELLSNDKMYNYFKEFFHMVYFKYLLVNPGERRVVISDAMLKSIGTRNVISEVLFKYFNVVSIAFMPSHLLALYACGVKTGLIVDCGYIETSIIPVYEECTILKAIQYISLAAKVIHMNINTEIMSHHSARFADEDKDDRQCLDSINENILEDIKIKCCFVGRLGYELTAASVQYPLNGKYISLSGTMRSNIFDALFQKNEEKESVPTAIVDAILNSPIDCRKEIAANIILVGGTVMSDGFSARLITEINLLLKTEDYNSKLFLKISIRKPLIPANYCTWLGGALFGAGETLSYHSISREEYRDNPVMPDWPSMFPVRKETGNKRPSLTTVIYERIKLEFES